MSMSRMEKLLERSQGERLFSRASYRICSTRDRRVGFKRIEQHHSDEAFVDFASAAKSVSAPTDDVEWNAMEKEIKAASFVLNIENDSEQDDFVLYTQDTLSRATDFLQRLMIRAHASNVVGIGVPQIGPADHGSIDLFWEKADRTLLINFPAGENIANYYGKKPKSEISGKFDPSEPRPELVIWLEA